MSNNNKLYEVMHTLTLTLKKDVLVKQGEDVMSNFVNMVSFETLMPSKVTIERENGEVLTFTTEEICDFQYNLDPYYDIHEIELPDSLDVVWDSITHIDTGLHEFEQ